ncbi:putative acetyltransferase [Candidatus Termititenax persephonae]|uniref:Acetyltransferase n=1 Tax=Candidatus Termititenax persephonae TaxID=2218525 RepID=A0A388TH69_9BACT|nr:putative acetyltransferase [Candidatus Termititenax persephonae]
MRKNIVKHGQEIGFVEYITAADELQILDVYVRPEYRRQGLAKNALRELLAENKNLANAYLEVRAANQPALSLYAKLGFARVGWRQAYYHNPVEDAVLMRRTLAS